MGNKKNTYLILISIHGLIRSNDLELVRNADTGVQIKFVVDLAKAFAEDEDFGQVELISCRVFELTVRVYLAIPIRVLSV